VIQGLRFQPDLILPRYRVAVFVDGCYWHGCPEHGRTPRSNTSYWSVKLERNRQRDLITTRLLELAGWSVVRVWEHLPVADASAEVVAATLRASSTTDLSGYSLS
jgi:DNA mismatch endonuclease (patch repair protein)